MKSGETESTPNGHEIEHTGDDVVVIGDGSPDKPELEARSGEESTTIDIQAKSDPSDLEARLGEESATTEPMPAMEEVAVIAVGFRKMDG